MPMPIVEADTYRYVFLFPSSHISCTLFYSNETCFRWICRHMITVNGLPQVNCKWSYFLHQSTNWMLLLCLEYDSAHHMSLFVMVPRLSKYKPVPHGDVPHHNNNIYTRHCPEYNGNWRVGGPIIATFSTYNNMFLQVRGRGVGEGSCAFVYAMGRRKRHHKPSETTTAERMRRHLVHILV